MNIKLKAIELNNFKGIESLLIDFESNLVNIFGKNASGKTTLYDAFCWLLFGKDSLGREDFGIKTYDKDGNTIPKLEHSVYAEFEINGKVIPIKRVYKEVYTHPRGSNEEVFKGHSTEFYIEGVKQSKSKYEEYISTWFGTFENARILTNCTYFLEQIDWKERRAILMNLVDVDPKVVLEKIKTSTSIDEESAQEYYEAVEPYISSLETAPKGTTCFTKAKGLADKIRRTLKPNEAAQKNTLSILKSSLPEKPELSAKEIMAKIESFKEKKVDESVTGAYNKACEDLKQAQMAYQELKQQYESNLEQDVLKNSIDYHLSMIKKTKENIKIRENKINELKAHNTTTLTCPNCNHEFSHTATNIKNIIESETTALKADKATLDELTSKYDELTEQLKEMPVDDKTELKEAVSNALEVYKMAQARVTKASEIMNDTVECTSSEIKLLQDELVNAINYENKIKEIKVAETAYKQASTELIMAEVQLDYLKQFCIDYTKEVEGKLNELLNGYATIIMSKKLTNGNIEECCEIAKDGVPYSYLNTASRINIGLGMIRILSSAYNCNVPVFVDNAESVEDGNMISMEETQLVKLIVSSDYPKLTVNAA